MPRIKGWERTYNGKPTQGKGELRPVVHRWESIFGDVVTVSRIHTYDSEGLVHYPEENELDEKEDKWYFESPNGQRMYFTHRVDATEMARSFMKVAHSDKDIEKIRRKQRASQSNRENEQVTLSQ